MRLVVVATSLLSSILLSMLPKDSFEKLDHLMVSSIVFVLW